MIRTRTRKCKICRAPFVPFAADPLRPWCSIDCGVIMGERKLKVAKRSDTRLLRQRKADELRVDKVRREALKTRRDYTKEAQTGVNFYARVRDAGKPCISSGRILSLSFKVGGSSDAGHFRSVGSAPHLRFHLWNIHGQSKHDNRHGYGAPSEYRKGLIARIGIEKVEMLEADQTPRKYSIDDLKRIARIFTKKAQRLIARRTNEYSELEMA